MCRYERTTNIERFYSQPGPPIEWATVIPSTGVLAFDFLSLKRPPVAAQPITQQGLVHLLEECGLRFVGNKPLLPAGALRAHLRTSLVANLHGAQEV